MVIYVFSEEKCNKRPIEKGNTLGGLFVFNEANSGNILIAFAPNTGKGKLFLSSLEKSCNFAPSNTPKPARVRGGRQDI